MYIIIFLQFCLELQFIKYIFAHDFLIKRKLACYQKSVIMIGTMNSNTLL